ncbi:hypothetical protein BS50DRAFT_80936 [Corynespora cassiicola Philippines]|uniref:Uncharacterized protein n=1 Tax=Corynespora cassiicola Philippines TaxID=1448308 RepID=A0A2T2NI82_CORCC|nr:hypothetical protein BS50DRAFT_80936 [Corynespora cassiicola Philippines]
MTNPASHIPTAPVPVASRPEADANAPPSLPHLGLTRGSADEQGVRANVSLIRPQRRYVRPLGR